MAQYGMKKIGVEEEPDWHLFAGKWVHDTTANLARIERETLTVRELTARVPTQKKGASLVADALRRRKKPP